MVMLATRARWSGPPQGVPVIDRGDPFARGLIYAGGAGIAPPGSTDGSAYFTRTNGLLTNVAQAAGSMHGYFTGDVPEIKTSAFGPALICDGTRKVFTQSITGTATGSTTVDETCLVLCSLGSSSGSQHIFGYGNVFSTSLADYGRGIGIEGGGLMAWGASASNGKKITATLPSLNRPVCLAARFSTTGALFVDGARVGTGDMSHTWSYYLAAAAGVAGTESVEVANFTGLIGLRLWWRRALSDAEIIEISRNPWRVFRKPDEVAFYTAGSSGSTGALDKTLAALTLTAAAEIANGPAATLTGTLGALTLSSESAVSSGPAATLAGTLAAVTLSSGAAVANGPAATLAATLGALTLAAEATSNTGPTAAVAGTLGALTLTSAATAANGPAATLAGTLAALSVSSAAEVIDYVAPADTSATLAGTFAVLTLVSSATIAGPDADLPRARRVGPQTLSPASRRGGVLRSARRIGDSTLRRAA